MHILISAWRKYHTHTGSLVLSHSPVLQEREVRFSICQIAYFDETIHPFEIPKNAGEKLGKEMTPSFTFGLP